MDTKEGCLLGVGSTENRVEPKSSQACPAPRNPYRIREKPPQNIQAAPNCPGIHDCRGNDIRPIVDTKELKRQALYKQCQRRIRHQKIFMGHLAGEDPVPTIEYNGLVKREDSHSPKVQGKQESHGNKCQINNGIALRCITFQHDTGAADRDWRGS